MTVLAPGGRRCYQAGCGHVECRAANAGYKRARAHRLGRPDEAWVPFVPAGPARRHLLELAAAGVGLAQAARLSGVGYSTLVALVRGDPRRGGRRSRRVRADTARAVLDVSAAAGGSRLVPAEATVRLVGELVGWGVPRARIARAVGRRSGQLRFGACVQADTADRVARLHTAAARVMAGGGR